MSKGALCTAASGRRRRRWWQRTLRVRGAGSATSAARPCCCCCCCLLALVLALMLMLVLTLTLLVLQLVLAPTWLLLVRFCMLQTPAPPAPDQSCPYWGHQWRQAGAASQAGAAACSERRVSSSSAVVPRYSRPVPAAAPAARAGDGSRPCCCWRLQQFPLCWEPALGRLGRQTATKAACGPLPTFFAQGTICGSSAAAASVRRCSRHGGKAVGPPDCLAPPPQNSARRPGRTGPLLLRVLQRGLRPACLRCRPHRVLGTSPTGPGSDPVLLPAAWLRWRGVMLRPATAHMLAAPHALCSSTGERAPSPARCWTAHCHCWTPSSMLLNWSCWALCAALPPTFRLSL